MTNSWFITQYRVDTLKKDDTEPEHIKISESEFTKLIRQQWPATPKPECFDKIWIYHPIKSENETSIYEITLSNNSIVGIKYLEEFVSLIVILQQYLKRPLYVWNAGDLETFLEITHKTTENDILLFLNSGRKTS